VKTEPGVGEGTSERAHRGPGRPPASGIGEGVDVGTRERVLKAARHLFLHRGYADVSVVEIAMAVGVTKPTLYYYFGDKEALYTEVLCDLLTEVGGYVRRVTQADLPLRNRLHALTLGYFQHADYTMEPMLRDATALLASQCSTRVWSTYQSEFLHPIEELIAEGVRTGELRAGSDTDLLVRAYMGLLDALTAPGGHLARSDAEHQVVAAALVGLFLDGAAAERARSVLSS
jgi:TetR/AcrR family transcriptional regulator